MRVVLPLLLLAALCWWFGLQPLGAAMAHVSGRGLAAYILLTATVMLGYALRWRRVARTVGTCPPLARLVAARLAGDAVGALVPSAKLAGEPLRVALVRGGETTTAQSTAGVAIDRLLELIGNMLAVVIYVAVFCATRGAAWAGQTLLLLGGAMALLAAGLAALLMRVRRGHRPLGFLYGVRARAVAPRLSACMDGLQRVEDHLTRFVREHPRPLLLGVLGSLAIEVLTVAQYHALLRAFGVGLDLPTLLLVLVGGGLSNVAPVPAGLGALEAAQVAIVGAAAGRPDIGFVVGVIVRLHTTLLLVLGLGALTLRGVSLARLRLAVQRASA